MAIDAYMGFNPKPIGLKDNVVGTPEGDNEFAPDEPLKKLPEDAEQVQRGGAPDAYRQPESRSATELSEEPLGDEI